MSRLQPLAELRALFRCHPALRQVFLADFACQMGDGGLLIAFPLLILEHTHDVSLTGLSFSGEILAFALLSPFAGQIADRLDQKRVMIGANVVRIALFSLLLLVLKLQAPIWALMFLSLALGCSGAFFMPARAALMRRLLDGKELEQAIALEGTMAFLVRLLSPAMMGMLLSVFPATLGIQLDMAAYAVAIACLLPSWVRGKALEVAPDEAELDWKEGWRIILRSSGLRGMLVLDTLLCLLGMAAFSMTIAFLADVMHMAPQANGYLLAATGLSGAIGTQLAGRIGRKPATYPVMTGAIALTYLLVPHAGSMPVLMLMWSLRGLAYGALGVLINQRIAQTVPANTMGRVNAAWTMTACVAAFAGTATTPFLLRSVGPAQAFTWFGMLLITVAAAMAVGWGLQARKAAALVPSR